MAGFGLIVGHLLGDYILQNDWQAKNKVNPWPGPEPHPNQVWIGSLADTDPQIQKLQEQRAWWDASRKWWIGHLACAVHCTLYTFAVWLCACWWLPWWGVPACWLAHYPADRFRLARLWMIHVSGQKDFATGALAPWSVIVVDNTFHLLVLFLIGLIAGVP